VLGARVEPELPDALVTGWSIDSRTINPGDLFFAIRGEKQDGGAYIHAAFQKGAVAAVAGDDALEADGPVLRVSDTLVALQTLGLWARRRWGKPVVAVTGSAGKTTTKDAIAALLDTRFDVGKTAGNLNNHLGVPLSLLRMPGGADVGVMELGMNHAGEIRALAALAEPQIGVVTNVGYAHIEAFDSVDAIALAKRELIESLPPDGVAVLNADDSRVFAFRDVFSGRVLTYGLSEQADLRAVDVEILPEGALFSVGGTRFRSSLLGRHGVLNVLAALAVATIFGIELQELPSAVSRLSPGRMRGERRQWRGVTILDDCYNSNPDAARFMIDVLQGESAGRRIAVLGEMLELGAWSERLHAGVGEYAAKAGIDVIIGIRGAARPLVDAASRRSAPGQEMFFFEEPETAGAFLRRFVKAGDAILFKGSRGTHVERALAAMES
jgi:UDP-N-acetylmuramoyl-tripeptide--D-alanyl-D-alanine ligase